MAKSAGFFEDFREWWHGLSDKNTREFLFEGAPRFLSWLLTVRAFPLFAILCLFGVGVIALSFAFNLDHILFNPADAARHDGETYSKQIVDLGIVSSVNWSLMIPFVLPYVFACASELNRRCYAVTTRLSSSKIDVIRFNQQPATNYPTIVQKKIASGQKLRLWISFWLTAVIMLALAYSWLAPALGWSHASQLDRGFQNRWLNAWLLPKPQVEMGWNLAYDTLMFLCEGFYIFLGFYWVWTFAAYLNTFSGLIASPKTPYNVNLWIEDRENRLGLGSLGRLFTGFLRISVIFLFYAACYSIMSAAWSLHESEGAFIYSVFKARNSMFDGLREMSFAPDTWALLWSQNQSDLSLRILQLCLFIPVAVVSYMPVVVMKRYLVERIEEARFRNIEARKAGSEDIEALDKEWEKLSKAEVWPCGNGTAIKYFVFMALLLIAAFFPAIGIGVCIAILLTVIAKQIKDWLPTPKWLG